MLADLQKRFPHAQMVGGDGKLDRLSKKVIKFIENPQSSLNISLDIRGTGFQRRVWGKLQKIPVGTTASYKDIANQLKMPQSMRAVAGACAANPLAVVIPCHRVVKNDGSLSGYRWGIKRKQKLLELEGVKRI